MNFSYESNSGSSCPNLAKLSSRVPRRAMVASNEGSLRAPSVLGSKSQKNSEKLFFGGNPPFTLRGVPAPAVVEVCRLIKLRCTMLLQVGVDVAHDVLGVAHDDAVVGYVFVDEGVRADDYVVADGHADSNRCAVPNLNHPRAVYINRAVLRGMDKGVVVAYHSQRVQIIDIIPAHVLGVINQLFDSQLQVHHNVLFLKASVDQD